MENIKNNLLKAVSKSISSSIKNIFNAIKNKKNNDSFFNDIKKVISLIILQLSPKNKKLQNEIDKLQKQIVKVLNNIKKLLQTEVLYKENLLSEITINAFLLNFKNLISNSLLLYTINIDKNLKKILQSNDIKDIKDKNQEIHLSLLKLYSTFLQNRLYINNIINKYTDNLVIIADLIYNNINVENDKLLKNIDNVLNLPSTNVKISDKKILSLHKKKYGSTVKSNEIDNKISSIQTSYEDDTDDNLLNNLHKLVVYNNSLNKKLLEIKSKIYTIKLTVNDITHSINELRGLEKINSENTKLIISLIFKNTNGSIQKPMLLQYTKGIFNNPKISKTYNTVLHTKETTDKIYKLLNDSFSKENIFSKLFGGITPDVLLNKIKDKELKIKKDIFKNDDVNSDELTQEQQPLQKLPNIPWWLLALLKLLKKLLKRVRNKNKVRKRPKTKRAKPKTKGKNARKALRAKGISKAEVKKFLKAFDDSYKKSLKLFDTAKQKFVLAEWKKILDDPNFKKLSPSLQLKFKEKWLKNINKLLNAIENVYHSNYKSVLLFTVTNCDASNLISESSNRLKGTLLHLSKLFGKDGDLWNPNTKIGKQFATKLRFSKYKLLHANGVKPKNLDSLRRVLDLTNIHIKNMKKYIKIYEKSVKLLARLNKDMAKLKRQLQNAKLTGDKGSVRSLEKKIKDLDSKIKSIELKKIDAEVNISHLHKKTTGIVRKYKAGLSQDILTSVKKIKTNTSFKNAVRAGNTSTKKFGIRPKTNGNVRVKTTKGRVFKVPKKMPTKVPVSRGAQALKMMKGVGIPFILMGLSAGMQTISFLLGLSDLKDSYKLMGLSDEDIALYTSLKRHDFYGGSDWIKGELLWNSVLDTNPLAVLDLVGFLTGTDIRNPFTMTLLKNMTKGRRQKLNENDPVWLLANPESNIKSHKTREAKIEDIAKPDIIQGLIYIASNTIDKVEKLQMINIDNMDSILQHFISLKELKTSYEYYKTILNDRDIYKFITNNLRNIIALINIAFSIDNSKYFADKLIPYIVATCDSQWLPAGEQLKYKLKNNTDKFKRALIYYRNDIVNKILPDCANEYAKYGDQKIMDIFNYLYIHICKMLIKKADIEEVYEYLNKSKYKLNSFIFITLMIIYSKQIFFLDKLKNELTKKKSKDDGLLLLLLYNALIFYYKKFIVAYLQCVHLCIDKLTETIQNTVKLLQILITNTDKQIWCICNITIYSIYVYILQILFKYFQIYCLAIPDIRSTSTTTLKVQFSNMAVMSYLSSTDPSRVKIKDYQRHIKENVIMQVHGGQEDPMVDSRNGKLLVKNEEVTFNSANNFISLLLLRNKLISNTTFIDSTLGITAAKTVEIYGKLSTLTTDDLAKIVPKLSLNAITALFNKNAYDTYYNISDFITVYNKYKDEYDKIKSVNIKEYKSNIIDTLHRYVSVCPIYYCGKTSLHTYIWNYLTKDDYFIWYVIHALTFGCAAMSPNSENVTTFECLLNLYNKRCKSYINNIPNIDNAFLYFKNIIDKTAYIYENVLKILVEINRIIRVFEALKDRTITPSFKQYEYLKYVSNSSLVKKILLDLNQQLAYSQYEIEVKTLSNSTYIIKKTYNLNKASYGSNIFYTNDNNSFKTFCEKIYDKSSRVRKLRQKIFEKLCEAAIDVVKKYKQQYNTIYFDNGEKIPLSDSSKFGAGPDGKKRADNAKIYMDEFNNKNTGKESTIFRLILQGKNVAEYFNGDQAVDLNNLFQFFVGQSIVKPTFKITQTKSREQADQEYKRKKLSGLLSLKEIKARLQFELRLKQRKKYSDSILDKYDRNIEPDIFGTITFS